MYAQPADLCAFLQKGIFIDFECIGFLEGALRVSNTSIAGVGLLLVKSLTELVQLLILMLYIVPIVSFVEGIYAKYP